jgi:hypothetical protein
MDLGYDYQAVRNRVWRAHMVPWITAWHEDHQRKQRDGTPPRRWVFLLQLKVKTGKSWLPLANRIGGFTAVTRSANVIAFRDEDLQPGR